MLRVQGLGLREYSWGLSDTNMDTTLRVYQAAICHSDLFILYAQNLGCVLTEIVGGKHSKAFLLNRLTLNQKP